MKIAELARARGDCHREPVREMRRAEAVTRHPLVLVMLLDHKHLEVPVAPSRLRWISMGWRSGSSQFREYLSDSIQHYMLGSMARFSTSKLDDPRRVAEAAVVAEVRVT